MNDSITHVLFDFDGTIVDTGEGITNAVAYALEHYGIHVPDYSALRPFVGPPLRDSFMEFYHLSAAQADEAAGIFREYYNRQGKFECRAYDGIGDLLEKLGAAGMRAALATSKPQVFAEQILEHCGLRRHFDYVSGADLDGTHSLKTDVIRSVLEHYRVGPQAALMVGDRKFDVEGAHAFGLRCVGVLYGYGSRAEFEAAGADVIVRDLPELERLLLG